MAIPDNNVQKILRLLIEDCKMPHTKIARKTGLTRQTISTIIDKLEKEGIIKGYIPIIDHKKMGQTSFLFLLKIKPPMDTKLLKKLILDLVNKNQNRSDFIILNSSIIHGEYDLSLIFFASSLNHAKKIVNEWVVCVHDLIDSYILLPEVVNIRTGSIMNPNLEKELSELYG